jgi:hypothetical protein
MKRLLREAARLRIADPVMFEAACWRVHLLTLAMDVTRPQRRKSQMR